MSHLIVLLWAFGLVGGPTTYVDACPQASATHYCLYSSPNSTDVLTTVTQSDCSTLELGVALGKLSSDVLAECS